MSLLLPPPTPGSNSRDYSKDDDSDSDISEDSAGLYWNPHHILKVQSREIMIYIHYSIATFEIDKFIADLRMYL